MDVPEEPPSLSDDFAHLFPPLNIEDDIGLEGGDCAFGDVFPGVDLDKVGGFDDVIFGDLENTASGVLSSVTSIEDKGEENGSGSVSNAGGSGELSRRGSVDDVSGSGDEDEKCDEDCKSEKGGKEGLVDLAKRRAEAFAAGEAEKRREKLGILGKRNADENPGPARKYQKRLEKNRNSAYVSRIRRRKYTKLLEESLDETEKEKDRVRTMYDELKHKYEVMSTELAVLKEAALKKIAGLTVDTVKSIGAATDTSSSPTVIGKSSTVVSMFALALLVAVFMPGSTTKYRTTFSGIHGSNESLTGGNILFPGQSPENSVPVFEPFFQDFYRQSPKSGKMWAVTPQVHDTFLAEEEDNEDNEDSKPDPYKEQRSVLDFINRNSTQIFGPERAEEARKMVQQTYEHIGAGSSADHAKMCKKDVQGAGGEHSTGVRIIGEDIDVPDSSKNAGGRQELIAKLAAMLPSLRSIADEKVVSDLINLCTLHLITEHRMRSGGKLGVN